MDVRDAILCELSWRLEERALSLLNSAPTREVVLRFSAGATSMESCINCMSVISIVTMDDVVSCLRTVFRCISTAAFVLACKYITSISHAPCTLPPCYLVVLVDADLYAGSEITKHRQKATVWCSHLATHAHRGSPELCSTRSQNPMNSVASAPAQANE
jgi:hypothetical protein